MLAYEGRKRKAPVLMVRPHDTAIIIFPASERPTEVAAPVRWLVMALGAVRPVAA